MAGLLKVSDLRDRFPFVIHKDTEDHQLKYSLAAASNRVRSWVSDLVYDAAVADEEDEERRILLSNAEGHLAMHYALLALNTNLTPKGLIRSENGRGDSVTTYFSPKEVESYSNQYLERAREIAEPYLEADGTPAAAFEIAEDGL